MTSPWPNQAKAAVSFTMDNLGEAQDVNRDVWPHPHGTHPSVTSQLPRMLSLLDRHAVKATYFVEAWSLGVYPAVVRQLLDRGHEVAWHGYQHEVWGGLSAEDEEVNFRKSFEAARELGITYEGFRPPGGRINERTWPLLKQYGVKYVSPLGEFGLGKEGIVVLPFEWRGVDAFYYMEKFDGIRREHGEGEAVMEPGQFRDFLAGKIEEVKQKNGFLSILFHPFLQTSEEKFEVLEEVLARIGQDQEIWLAPCNQVANWVKEHAGQFKPKNQTK